MRWWQCYLEILVISIKVSVCQIKFDGGQVLRLIGTTLLFGAESFVFQFAIQKFKDQDIKNYNFVRCPVWV